jgi:hypothetical protein
MVLDVILPLATHRVALGKVDYHAVLELAESHHNALGWVE